MRKILIGCELSPLFLVETKGIRIGGSGWKGEDRGEEESRQEEGRDGMHLILIDKQSIEGRKEKFQEFPKWQMASNSK